MTSILSRRSFLAATSAPAVLAQRRKKPNILLIVTDQQRFDTIRVLGNRHIETPNLEALVRSGVTFTHATTPSPVCMPARWSMQTGQWTSTHRCYSNHHPGEPPPLHISNMLRQAGYRTALIGKNHSYLREPDFDRFIEHPPPSDKAAWQARQEWLEINKARYPRLSDEAIPGGPEGDPMRGVTEQSVRFMADSGDKPFFCFASYLHPHTPYYVPDPYFSSYARQDLPEPVVEPSGLAASGKPFRQIFHQRTNDAVLPFDERRTRIMKQVYYAMVTQVDEEIGSLLAWVNGAGRERDTLVVFTSDHGDYMGDHGLYTKSPAMYDCLVRIPFIMRWPGALPAGRRDNSFISTVDLMATFASAVGIGCPSQSQGQDLLPVAKGEQAGPSFAVSEYGVPGEKPYSERTAPDKVYTNPWTDQLPWEGNPVALAGRFRMIRTHGWKYVHEPGGTNELYDLKADPNELLNLAGQQQFRSTERALRRKLDGWKGEVLGSTA